MATKTLPTDDLQRVIGGQGGQTTRAWALAVLLPAMGIKPPAK